MAGAVSMTPQLFAGRILAGKPPGTPSKFCLPNFSTALISPTPVSGRRN
jgi:hypothetical protein